MGLVLRESCRAPRKGPADIDVSNFYATYLEYNRVLRTWFVGFGVGGPVLFLVQ